MKKVTSVLLGLAFSQIFAQSYAPQIGSDGALGIPYQDSRFVGWATGAEVEVGYLDVINPDLGFVNGGNIDLILNEADGATLISLGDGGSATLYFEDGISNGEGPDFAVFENGFIVNNDPNQAFLELAFVDVSSNGTDFFRFPAITEYNESPIGAYETMDARYLYNFAGKYTRGYGTPFDLDEIQDNDSLNKDFITHVRVVDVIGTTNPNYATYDSNGTIVTDPFPTAFNEGGFDLDGVGVLHEGTLSALDIKEDNQDLTIFPNPVTDKIFVAIVDYTAYKIYSFEGKLVQSGNKLANYIEVNKLQMGQYVLILNGLEQDYSTKFIKK